MAHFDLHLRSPLPADVAWARVLDLRAHTAVIPFTTLSGDQLEAAGLTAGSRFVARTALGPLGFDDVMVIESVTQPTADSAGRARIRKDGKVIAGFIDLTVSPSGSGSTVDWSQQIAVRRVPRLADRVVALVARTAYGTTLRRLLARD